MTTNERGEAMGADWDYAQLARTASQNGGPLAYLDSMKHGAKVNGRVQGLVVGAALVAACLKGYEYNKNKRRLAAVAEQELLAGMGKATQAHATAAPSNATVVEEPSPAAQAIPEGEPNPEGHEASNEEDGPNEGPPVGAGVALVGLLVRHEAVRPDESDMHLASRPAGVVVEVDPWNLGLSALLNLEMRSHICLLPETNRWVDREDASRLPAGVVLHRLGFTHSDLAGGPLPRLRAPVVEAAGGASLADCDGVVLQGEKALPNRPSPRLVLEVLVQYINVPKRSIGDHDEAQMRLR